VLVTNVATPAPEVALAPAPPPLETAQKPRAPRPATRRAPRVASLPALPRPICTDERGCDTTDLQRCLAHDGDGCANVGRYYEVDRADPFSAITWYRKGCELSNGPACNALDRVKGARPREGTLRDDPLAASMPVMAADSPKTATKL
jgi:hypothetical protein